MTSRSVLLVSYHFPPHGGAGTQRVVKLCRYLGNFGWEPTVVCADGDPSSGIVSSQKDERMLSEIPVGVRVVRIEASRPVAWVDRAWSAVRDEAESGTFDAAIVTMSPFWLAGLAGRLSSLVPTVVDLRDPWALDGVPTYRSVLEWRRDLAIMGRTLRGAAASILNTPEARERVLEAFGGLDPGRVHAITNGFDADDLRGAVAARRPDGARFMLVHTGTFLTSQVERPKNLKQRVRRVLRYRPEKILPVGRTIVPLLGAMELLREREPDRASGFRLVHVGTLDDATRGRIERSGVPEMVHTTGYVPHDESVGWLLAADALFLHLHGLPAGARSRIVPGKTYEYLASGRPIVAALPSGDARDFVDASGRGFFADPCSEEQIVSAIVAAMDGGHGVAVEPLSDSGIARFERRSIAERVAGVLHKIVGDDKAVGIRA